MNNLSIVHNSDVVTYAQGKAAAFVDQSADEHQRELQLTHYMFVEVAKLGKAAGLTLRDLAAEMYLTAGYKELALPYPTNPKEKIYFEYFENWLAFAVDAAGLSDTTTSTLKNFMLNVVDPVAKQLIANPATGLPYTVQEVLGLREQHTQKLASAARRVIKNDDLTNEDKYSAIAELIEMAADPTKTQSDYVDELAIRGLINRRIEPFAVFQARSNGKTVYMITVDEPREPVVNTALEGRSTIRQKTVDDLMSDLMSLQVTQEELADVVSPVEDGGPDGGEAPSDADVSKWLGDME